MLIRLIIAGVLFLIHLAPFGGAAAQTRSNSRAGCVKQTKQIRRGCLSYISAGHVPDNKLLAKPKPTYPADAKERAISGSVFVIVMVDADGKVTEAIISSGPPLLQKAALDAAKQALFRPVKLSGVPIRLQAVLRYDFVLGREP